MDWLFLIGFVRICAGLSLPIALLMAVMVANPTSRKAALATIVAGCVGIALNWSLRAILGQAGVYGAGLAALQGDPLIISLSGFSCFGFPALVLGIAMSRKTIWPNEVT